VLVPAFAKYIVSSLYSDSSKGYVEQEILKLRDVEQEILKLRDIEQEILKLRDIEQEVLKTRFLSKRFSNKEIFLYNVSFCTSANCIGHKFST